MPISLAPDASGGNALVGRAATTLSDAGVQKCPPPHPNVSILASRRPERCPDGGYPSPLPDPPLSSVKIREDECSCLLPKVANSGLAIHAWIGILIISECMYTLGLLPTRGRTHVQRTSRLPRMSFHTPPTGHSNGPLPQAGNTGRSDHRLTN